MKKMKVRGVLLVAIFFLTYAQLVKGQIASSCPTKCGNITLEYPFGTSPGCYYEQDRSFNLTCNDRDELIFADNKVIKISHSGELRVWLDVSYECDNGATNSYRYMIGNLTLSTKNKLTLVGCNALALLNTFGLRNHSSGCISSCDSPPESNRKCDGEGCCMTDVSVPLDTDVFSFRPARFINITSVNKINPCIYAFLVENGTFDFDTWNHLQNLRHTTKFPVILDWSIGNQTCDQANKTICGENNICSNSTSGKGYICQCVEGYYGNPYLSDDCKDIDECTTNSHNCPGSSTCENLVGSFHCKCPSGYHLDTTNNSCKRKEFGWTVILLGVTIGVLVILLGVSFIQQKMKCRKEFQLKQHFFEQNGGGMLVQQLSRAGSSNINVKIFTEACMKKATSGYDESRILGQGGQGTVYKGILPDNSIIAIKKARLGDRSQVEQFINEMLLLSQINHRNVVKLLGCCLETEVPLLVYEFINNGTLFDHLHGSMSDPSLSWEHRLRIAVEVAGTLGYLHSSASVPIIHRDVKTANILLDENLTAKVADFGASRLIPMDKEQLTTMVQGTFGYLDPEYYNTGLLNEKSDVYSFGVVLMELLTGQQALCFERSQASKHLVSYFTSAATENRLHEIIDGKVMNEYNQRELHEAAKITVECTRVKGEERPKMKEVAAELEVLRVDTIKHKWSDQYPEEIENLLGGNNLSTQGDTSSSGYDSIKNVARLDIEIGR